MAEDEELYKNGQSTRRIHENGTSFSDVETSHSIARLLLLRCKVSSVSGLPVDAEVNQLYVRFCLDFRHVQTELSEYDVLPSQVRPLDWTACGDRVGPYLRIRLVNKTHGGF